MNTENLKLKTEKRSAARAVTDCQSLQSHSCRSFVLAALSKGFLDDAYGSARNDTAKQCLLLFGGQCGEWRIQIPNEY